MLHRYNTPRTYLSILQTKYSLFQVFLPLYIIDTIGTLNKAYVGLAPLCSYIFGLLASFPMRAINKRLGRKITMLLGIVFVIASTIFFWFLYDIHNSTTAAVILLITCALLGIGTSTTNICSFSLTSDLIGLNTECGAFVYGIMSFADKLANGVIIALIQQFNPCTNESTPTCEHFYRNILTFIPAVVSIGTIAMIISIWRVEIGGNRHEMILTESSSLIEGKDQSANAEDHRETSSNA